MEAPRKCKICDGELVKVTYHDCADWNPYNDALIVHDGKGGVRRLRVCESCGLLYGVEEEPDVR